MADASASTRLPLSAEHLAELRASGLTDDTILLAQIRTETDRTTLGRMISSRKEGAKFRPWGSRRGSGLVFPFFLPGRSVPYLFRVKPFNPQFSDGKYLSPPGSGNAIYYPPRTLAESRHRDPSLPLYWVEGEKKALALDQLGLAVIGITGAESFHDSEYKKQTGQWVLHSRASDHAVIADREHVAVYDNDARTNTNVMRGAGRLTRVLLEAGAKTCRFVCPPPGPHKGIDDFFAAFGDRVTLDLLASAEPIEPYQEREAPKPMRSADASGEFGLPPGVVAGTDLALAHLVQAKHGEDLRYAPSLGALAWDGHHWKRDTTGESERRIHDIARGLEIEAAEMVARAADLPKSAKSEREALQQRAADRQAWAKQAQRGPRIDAAVKVLRTLREVVVEPDALDRDPALLSSRSGTHEGVDMQVREHRREDLITKIANASHDPDAKAPTWLAFTERILPDAEVRAFVQRALGYSLTGHTSEQCMFVCYGTGANGKSTLLETVRHVLGDYAVHVQTDTLMAIGRPRGADNDLMRLRGARLVTAVETGEDRKLDEPRIKALTGGDTIAARLLYREPIEFKPVCKIWLATNHRPAVTGSDHAIWRRLRLIPFEVQIPEQERDQDLLARLTAEADGVLSWMLEGARQWAQGGLRPPQAVLMATEDWRQESDELSRFVGECCVVMATARARSGHLYAAYVEWAKSQGNREPLSSTAFGRRLTEGGFAEKKSSGVRYRRGLGLSTTQADGRGRENAEL